MTSSTQVFRALWSLFGKQAVVVMFEVAGPVTAQICEGGSCI
jgi:hypothetical protein